MRKFSVIACISLMFVLLTALSAFAGGGGDGDPISTSQFANQDWSRYTDIKMTYDNDHYVVKYPKMIGESYIITDAVEPVYNGTSSDITRTITSTDTKTYTSSSTFSISYSVGFEFEGFSSGYEISASQTTTYSNQSTRAVSTTYTVKPGNTLYVYSQAAYYVEAGENHIYDRTGGDANTWRDGDVYAVHTPKNASSGAKEVSGNHAEPYWEYWANASNVYSGLVQQYAQKYIDHINTYGTSYDNLTKDWFWSKPHNTDGNYTTGIFTVGIKYDWNLPTIYGAPQGCIDYMNNWNGIPTKVWEEQYYSFY